MSGQQPPDRDRVQTLPEDDGNRVVRGLDPMPVAQVAAQ
jgi:hypothetical protein